MQSPSDLPEFRTKIKLDELTTKPPEEAKKKARKKLLRDTRDELFQVQNKFYADSRYSLLIILQGLDTSGKDGTIRHAFSSMNPQGVQVKSFKKPTDSERDHDFLWRIYPHFPEKGIIKIFNRSYYEDILMPEINGSHGKGVLKHRLNLVNELEQHLLANNTLILKFFLHISAEEQLERIEERKEKPHKRWKYAPEDEQVPKKWDDYCTAYERLLNDCNQIPWHIIPSDKRWYRNSEAALILLDRLKKLDLKYPGS